MARRKKESISRVEYGVGFSSFIPGLGVFLAVGAIILGALRFKAGGIRLVLLGIGGILFSALLAVLFYLHLPGKSIPASIHRQVGMENLKECVMAIEYYKLVHGAYPTKLEDLVANHRNTCIYDFSAAHLSGGALVLSQYQLQPGGRHYTLFDMGPDGVSGTADDVYPDILTDEAARIGYIKK